MAGGGRVLVSAATEARALPYLAALSAAGVQPGAIQVVSPGSVTDRTALDGCTGLVLCGGADVEPTRYGESALPGAGVDVVAERDELEWQLLALARERRLPVWGVCRGFQLLNVFLGGSLWQDLPLQRPGAAAHDREQPPDLLAHAIDVLEARAPLGCRLAAAGTSPLVNSRHHQGIKRLAPALLAVAAASDGLIEAAVGIDAADGSGGPSGPGGWWVRGVQWHPENLLALPEQLALWRDFAAAVGASGVSEVNGISEAGGASEAGAS